MASVTMPQLGESITEGTIARWLKKVGDPVKKYESLVEVITDKVNAEVPAPVAGVLKEIRVQEGTTVTVGTEICVIEESQLSPPSREGQGRVQQDEVIPLSPIRRSIATHMVKSKQTTPHAWTVAEVDMTNVVRFRRSVKESFKQREGVDLTYLPIVIKGVVEQLKDNPRLNASWGEDKILVHHDFNIGIAVSIDDGLVVPVIHQADKLSIAALAKATDDLARRARAQKLTLPDVQGGTFTVNNPGTFGNILSYAIINSPEAAILSMEAIVKRPVVLDGDAVAVRSMMNLCLSFDHRVMDGANAARFLQGLRRWLEGVSEQLPLY